MDDFSALTELHFYTNMAFEVCGEKQLFTDQVKTSLSKRNEESLQHIETKFLQRLVSFKDYCEVDYFNTDTQLVSMTET